MPASNKQYFLQLKNPNTRKIHIKTHIET